MRRSLFTSIIALQVNGFANAFLRCRLVIQRNG